MLDGRRMGRIAGVAAMLVAAAGTCGWAEERYGAPPAGLAGKLDRLVRAYPDFIARHDGATLTLKNGTRFAVSDGRSDKTFDQLLETPDIDDMFYAAYPAGAAPGQPARNADPGRVRFEPLFVAMYGDCTRGGVARHLRTIEWLPKHGGGRVAVTTVNGVDKALEAVSRELDTLPAAFAKYLKPSAGTYNCRLVAGSRVRSVHAYGAAIDLNSAFSHYWRWAKGDEPRWQNRIPVEVVRVFEKHGFIWGGAWYHYDTMHFEYRPELLP